MPFEQDEERDEMICPVCKKEARTHIYKCALHGVYVHEKCWKEHVAKEHKD
jgi:hypothetical protein